MANPHTVWVMRACIHVCRPCRSMAVCLPLYLAEFERQTGHSMEPKRAVCIMVEEWERHVDREKLPDSDLIIVRDLAAWKQLADAGVCTHNAILAGVTFKRR